MRTVLAGLITSAALALTAPAAMAGTYTLNLAAPPSANVGQPAVIQASGSNPPDDFFSSWLDVAAIPASVVAACPAGYLNASQIASSTSAQGGENIGTALREDVDGAGNFSMPLAWSPSTPGRFLICGYTNDGATATLATSSLTMTVQGGSPPAGPGPVQPPPAGAARPANVAKPRVSRSGRRLTCSRGTWSGGPTSFSYRWLAKGKCVGSGSKLAVTRRLRGRKMQCAVTASNAAGAATAMSRALRVR
jgi:hypothetical protein